MTMADGGWRWFSWLRLFLGPGEWLAWWWFRADVFNSVVKLMVNSSSGSLLTANDGSGRLMMVNTMMQWWSCVRSISSDSIPQFPCLYFQRFRYANDSNACCFGQAQDVRVNIFCQSNETSCSHLKSSNPYGNEIPTERPKDNLMM